jgi:Amt family ammonium transporter
LIFVDKFFICQFFGVFFTGVFATGWVANSGGANIPGGAVDGNPILIGYNLAGACAIAGWSFVLSYVLLWLISRIPGMGFRTSEEQELYGDDLGEMGGEET